MLREIQWWWWWCETLLCGVLCCPVVWDCAHPRLGRQLDKLLRRGIAYHHAGMLPILREYVEL